MFNLILKPSLQHLRRFASEQPTLTNTATSPLLAGHHKTPIVNYLWSTREAQRAVDPSLPKTVSGSLKTIDYPLSSDSVLRDTYMNPWGSIRMGRLFEDLDALAGNIAAAHCAASPRPLSLVTASVDRVTISQQPSVLQDMQLSGRVVWVGRSSMDIHMSCAAAPPSGPSSAPSAPWLSSSFIFVAQDIETGRAAEIPAVSAESAEERRVFEHSQARYEQERAARAAQKEKQKVGGALALLSWPSEQAMAEARALILQARCHHDFPLLTRHENEVLMSDTRLSNALICQPQHRNMRGNVFGGFLIRRAFELAHSTAYLLAGTQPRFKELDHVQFLRPVSVGTLLRLESVVLYTDQSHIHVEVIARTTQPEARSSSVSTVFHFTFEVSGTSPLPVVLPDTIEDARKIVLQKHHNVCQEQCQSKLEN